MSIIYRFILIGIFMCAVLNLTAQSKKDFCFGASVSTIRSIRTFLNTSTNKDITIRFKGTYFAGTLCYRKEISNKANKNVVLAFPMSLGLVTAGDFRQAVFAVEIPSYIDFNFKLNDHSADDVKKSGYYLGCGVNALYMIGSNDAFNYFERYSLGPVVRAGFLFHNNWVNGDPQPMKLGLYYKVGLEKSHFRSLGINFLVDFR